MVDSPFAQAPIPRLDQVPLNVSGGLTAGTATDVFDDGRLGVIGTVSLSNKWRTRNVRSQSVLADFTLNSDFRDTVTDNRILLNGLVGVGLEVGDHVIRWTNLFIRDSVKLASLAQGTDFNDDDDIQRIGQNEGVRPGEVALQGGNAGQRKRRTAQAEHLVTLLREAEGQARADIAAAGNQHFCHDSSFPIA